MLVQSKQCGPRYDLALQEPENSLLGQLYALHRLVSKDGCTQEFLQQRGQTLAMYAHLTLRLINLQCRQYDQHGNG